MTKDELARLVLGNHFSSSKRIKCTHNNTKEDQILKLSSPQKKKRFTFIQS